jgi:hypothetical protein
MSKDYRSINEASCRFSSAREWASWREGEEGWGPGGDDFDFPDDLDDKISCDTDCRSDESDD